MKRIFMIFFMSLVFLAACTSTQINQTLGEINGVLGGGDLSTAEVVSGLKEALIKGASEGAENASKTDGYFGNPLIKIPFPPEVKKVEDKLRQIGLGNEVDKFILTLNRGAEDAASEAGPIFINAIRSMSIQDAWGILQGDKTAATDYLKRKTSPELIELFSPIIEQSLDKVNATKYYGDVVSTYNKIPLVEDVDSDLNAYATQKAIDGLFVLIAQEEEKIRENPAERTTALLKKVFSAQD